MKKVILMLLIGFYGFSQELPKITKEGFAPIVVNVEGKNASEIYAKAKEWIHTYFKNPSEVLKADIANDMIRIEGYAVNGFQTKVLGMVSNFDYSYVLTIEFKEGRYRYDYRVIDFYNKGSRVFYGHEAFFKADGSVRKSYQLAYDTINETANATSISLFNYITGKSQKEKGAW